MTSSTSTALTAVTQAGVYDAMPAQTYLSDPVPGGSLSSSGARRLLPPSCPARFRYERDYPPPPTQDLEIGAAFHTLVLGEGPDLVKIDADDRRTAAARKEADNARANGAIPLLPVELDRVQAMAAAIREHPIAGALFAPGTGRPEQSLFWQDDATGVWRRARLDWLPNPGDGRLIIPDLKSTRSADLRSLERTVHTYGYHQQAAWYLAGVEALGLGDDTAFVFVFQEKTLPYLVTVVELDTVALRIGDDLNRRAIEIYRDCCEADVWPGYSTDIELISLPRWATTRHQESSW